MAKCEYCTEDYNKIKSYQKYCSKKCGFKAFRKKNPEYYIKYSKDNRDKQAEQTRNWRINNADKTKALNRLYKKVNKQKVNARNVVYKHKQELPKQCSFCDSEIIEYHHHDYSKPLEVLPVCKKHHQQLHETMRWLELLS